MGSIPCIILFSPPFQYLCDGAVDCTDGYDEDPFLCTAGTDLRSTTNLHMKGENIGANLIANYSKQNPNLTLPTKKQKYWRQI